MKKLVWIFGRPGAGKKTLINHLTSDDNDVKKVFGLEDKKLSVVDVPYKSEGTYTDIHGVRSRIDILCEKITEFLRSDSDVLLIEGHHLDYENNLNNILAFISREFPNEEKEILFLNPNSLDVLYDRFKETEWFKKDSNNLERFPKTWLEIAVNYARSALFSFDGEDYSVYEVDTTDGYVIKKDKPLSKIKENKDGK